MRHLNSAADRLEATLNEVDEANQQDPNDHQGTPRALVQGRSASKWLAELSPNASFELQIAARAHHLKRWELARSDFPEGRAGYLNWRRTNKKHQAAETVKIMSATGFDSDAQERVSELLQRRKLATDLETQTLEDVACLVFIETEFERVADKLDEEKMVEVVSKTLAKMSTAAIETAAAIPTNETCKRILNLAAKS